MSNQGSSSQQSQNNDNNKNNPGGSSQASSSSKAKGKQAAHPAVSIEMMRGRIERWIQDQWLFIDWCQDKPHKFFRWPPPSLLEAAADFEDLYDQIVQEIFTAADIINEINKDFLKFQEGQEKLRELSAGRPKQPSPVATPVPNPQTPVTPNVQGQPQPPQGQSAATSTAPSMVSSAGVSASVSVKGSTPANALGGSKAPARATQNSARPAPASARNAQQKFTPRGKPTRYKQCGRDCRCYRKARPDAT